MVKKERQKRKRKCYTNMMATVTIRRALRNSGAWFSRRMTTLRASLKDCSQPSDHPSAATLTTMANNSARARACAPSCTFSARARCLSLGTASSSENVLPLSGDKIDEGKESNEGLDAALGGDDDDDDDDDGNGSPLQPRFRFWKKRNRVVKGPSFWHKSDPSLSAAADGGGGGLVPLPHFMFAGRTNVGKSMLISNLLGKKNIARASSVAGKTDAINTLVVNNAFVITDLPGHGGGDQGPRKTATMHVDREWRRTWRALVFKFISRCTHGNRPIAASSPPPHHADGPPLLGLFYLCDIKSPTTQEDKEFIEAFRQAAPGVPIVLVLTKDDLVKSAWRRRQLQNSICDRLDWPADGPMLHYTAKPVTRRCRNHLRRYITSFLVDHENSSAQETEK